MQWARKRGSQAKEECHPGASTWCRRRCRFNRGSIESNRCDASQPAHFYSSSVLFHSLHFARATFTTTGRLALCQLANHKADAKKLDQSPLPALSLISLPAPATGVGRAGTLQSWLSRAVCSACLIDSSNQQTSKSNRAHRIPRNQTAGTSARAPLVSDRLRKLASIGLGGLGLVLAESA